MGSLIRVRVLRGPQDGKLSSTLFYVLASTATSLRAKRRHCEHSEATSLQAKQLTPDFQSGPKPIAHESSVHPQRTSLIAHPLCGQAQEPCLAGAAPSVAFSRNVRARHCKPSDVIASEAKQRHCKPGKATSLRAQRCHCERSEATTINNPSLHSVIANEVKQTATRRVIASAAKQLNCKNETPSFHPGLAMPADRHVPNHSRQRHRCQ